MVERDDPYIVVSTDGHCGATVLGYKLYLEARFHDEFDQWANSYHDAWEDLDGEHDINFRYGGMSSETEINSNSAARLAYTEAEGIAAEVLFPNTSPPFYPSGALAAPGRRTKEEYDHRFAGIRAHNRWLADFCNETPGRRAGFAQVFLDDVDDAIAEVQWAKEHGSLRRGTYEIRVQGRCGSGSSKPSPTVYGPFLISSAPASSSATLTSSSC